MTGLIARDVVYHTPQGVELLARLYIPPGDGPFPAVVGVHGGRWCAETRLTNEVIDRALAQTGILVMALDFRMPPQVKFPYPVADINCAIRWLRTKASELRVNPSWIGAVGTSSGGHQVLLTGLLPEDPRFRLDHPPALATIDPRLAFIVACWPVSDPLARYRYAIAGDMHLHVHSHEAYWADEAEMNDGSPQRLVSEGAAACLPPLLVIQGGKDAVLTPGMSERFVAAYQAAGGEVEIGIFPNEGHTFITKSPETASAQAAIKSICTFVHAQIDQRSKSSRGQD